MKILVINAGSSSIKYQFIDMTNESVLAKGMCDRIGISGGNFKHKVPGKEDYKLDIEMKNHEEAINLVIKTLTDKEVGVIGDMAEINAEVTEFSTAVKSSQALLSLQRMLRMLSVSALTSDPCTILTILQVFLPARSLCPVFLR